MTALETIATYLANEERRKYAPHTHTEQAID